MRPSFHDSARLLACMQISHLFACIFSDSNASILQKDWFHDDSDDQHTCVECGMTDPRRRTGICAYSVRCAVARGATVVCGYARIGRKRTVPIAYVIIGNLSGPDARHWHSGGGLCVSWLFVLV